MIQGQIRIVEQKISELESNKNAKMIKEQISSFQIGDGSFSQVGLWKLRKKLLPRQSDPPMGKKDLEGNLITGTEALKELYISTYVERLKHREIKPEFQDIYQLKSVLWDERFKNIKCVKSSPWTISDIKAMTKKLKNNQTRDPIGMVNELIKPNIMGKDLQDALLSLMN